MNRLCQFNQYIFKVLTFFMKKIRVMLRLHDVGFLNFNFLIRNPLIVKNVIQPYDTKSLYFE